MPDRYGFDHLGTEVRCIDCPTGGPIWTWPEERRYQHARTHRAIPTTDAPEFRRQRNLLALPPDYSHEEGKETTTMAKTTTTKSESTKAVTVDVLAKAAEPLPAREIARRVIDSGRCTNLKGKTPEATISAMLAVGSKPGGPFKRVSKGTYTLADTNPPGPPTPPKRGRAETARAKPHASKPRAPGSKSKTQTQAA